MFPRTHRFAITARPCKLDGLTHSHHRVGKLGEANETSLSNNRCNQRSADEKSA